MSCICPTPLRSADPRRDGICARCARSWPEPALTPDRISEFFETMREALEAAGKIKRPAYPGDSKDETFAWFQYRCEARMREGAKTYGHNNFMRPDIDLVNEALEEQMDTANYVLMELTKHGEDADAASLGEAVCFAFYSAQALLRYRDKIRGRP